MDKWHKVFILAASMNFILMFFNLIPAPPLDGGAVVRGLIPRSWVGGYDKLSVYGPFVLMAVVFIPQIRFLFSSPRHLVARDVRRPRRRAHRRPGVSDPARGYQVELQVFEGPLDLLLHLVRKHDSTSWTSRSRSSPRSTSVPRPHDDAEPGRGRRISPDGRDPGPPASRASFCPRRRRSEPGGDGELEEGDGSPPGADPPPARVPEVQGGRPPPGAAARWSVATCGPAARPRDAVAEGIDLDRLAPLADVPVLKLVEALDRVLRSAKVRSRTGSTSTGSAWPSASTSWPTGSSARGRSASARASRSCARMPRWAGTRSVTRRW